MSEVREDTSCFLGRPYAYYDSVSYEGLKRDDTTRVACFRSERGDYFTLSSEEVDDLLQAGKRRGDSFLPIKLARVGLDGVAHLNFPHTTMAEMFRGIINGLGGPVIGTVLASSALVASLHVGLYKAVGVRMDSTNGAYLNAAVPVADTPGLTYDSKRQTYFQTTGSPRQLLSWTFNEKGDLKEACVIKVRQPGDGTLAWWAVPKYDPKCISGADSSLLIKLPAPPLPRPQ